jgi:hypothetical protein
VGTTLVDTSDKEADTVGSLAVDLSVDLGLFTDHVDEGAEWHSAAVSEAVTEALLLHEVGEDARVGGEASDGDAGVLIDGEELLLV